MAEAKEEFVIGLDLTTSEKIYFLDNKIHCFANPGEDDILLVAEFTDLNGESGTAFLRTKPKLRIERIEYDIPF